MGGVEDFRNFINAVIDEPAFNKISGYIANAKKDGIEIVAGGNYDKSKGYFIEPTVLLVNDPHYTTMEEEIFGPVLTAYVYDDNKFEETLELLDKTSPYALTGSIFANDRYAVEKAYNALEGAAGNFYINDKPQEPSLDNSHLVEQELRAQTTNPDQNLTCYAGYRHVQ